MSAIDGVGICIEWDCVMTSDSSGKVPETGTRRTSISLSKGFQHLKTGKPKPTATQKRRARKPRSGAAKPGAETAAQAER